MRFGLLKHSTKEDTIAWATPCAPPILRISPKFFFDGRILENFKPTTGAWVSVGAVRAALVDSMDGLVRDAVVTGENEAEPGALLILSEKTQRMAAADFSAVLSERQVRDRLGKSDQTRLDP